MGGTRMSSDAWTTYATTHIAGKTTDRIYSSTNIHKDLNPIGVNRESCDSVANPNSNAIIIGLDVTGSMSPVLDSMVRSVGDLFKELYSRKPVSDPHIMFMGIGDVHAGDIAPLQVTQFEADVVLVDQLTKVWLEQRGGGNNFESYILAWYFAAMHTSIDCFSKRNKKGYLFTIGDEEPTPSLETFHLKTVFGDEVQAELTNRFTNEALLAMASQRYEVFHIMVEQGNHYSHNGSTVKTKWNDLLGQRAIGLRDHTKLAEVIISTIQMNEGVDKEEIIESWDGSTSIAVAAALSTMTNSVKSDRLVVEF